MSRKLNATKQQTVTTIKRLPQVLQTARVTIRGIRPLLMSSPKEMYLTNKKRIIKEKVGADLDTRVEAEKRAYRDKDEGWTGDLCVPANCVLKNMTDAAKLHAALTSAGKRVRGQTLQDKVKGSIDIEPDNIPLLDHDGKQVTDYIVNAAKVVVRATKGSVIRYRPEIKEWQLTFKVKWNPALYGVNESNIKEILEAGGYLGLLDFRPRFGTYEMIEFDVEEE